MRLLVRVLLTQALLSPITLAVLGLPLDWETWLCCTLLASSIYYGCLWVVEALL